MKDLNPNLVQTSIINDIYLEFDCKTKSKCAIICWVDLEIA